MRVINLLFFTGLILSAAADKPTLLGGKTLPQTFQDARVLDLTQAAVHGDASTVTRLAKAGVPVNAKGQQDVSPLLWAVLTHNLAGTEALLKAGADPNQRSLYGKSPVCWAAGQEQSAILALLLRHGGNPNGDDAGKIDTRPLVNAAYEQQLENVKLLIAAGADVNVHDEYDASAASKACSQGEFEIVAYLLDHGYSFNLSDLGARVHIRHVAPDSERGRWKDQVIEKLKARGVTWPTVWPPRQ